MEDLVGQVRAAWFFSIHNQPEYKQKNYSDVKLVREEKPADKFKNESFTLFSEELSE